MSKRPPPLSPTSPNKATKSSEEPAPVLLSLLPQTFTKARFSPKNKMTLSKLATNQLARFVVQEPASPIFLGVTPTEVSVIIDEDDAVGWGDDKNIELEAGWRCFRVEDKESSLARKYRAFLLAGCCVRAEIKVMFESTCDTEYLLVREGKLARAITAFNTDKCKVVALEEAKASEEDEQLAECTQM
jgi:hypothetical protein